MESLRDRGRLGLLSAAKRPQIDRTDGRSEGPPLFFPRIRRGDNKTIIGSLTAWPGGCYYVATISYSFLLYPNLYDTRVLKLEGISRLKKQKDSQKPGSSSEDGIIMLCIKQSQKSGMSFRSTFLSFFRQRQHDVDRGPLRRQREPTLRHQPAQQPRAGQPHPVVQRGPGRANIQVRKVTVYVRHRRRYISIVAGRALRWQKSRGCSRLVSCSKSGWLSSHIFDKQGKKWV